MKSIGQIIAPIALVDAQVSTSVPAPSRLLRTGAQGAPRDATFLEPFKPTQTQWRSLVSMFGWADAWMMPVCTCQLVLEHISSHAPDIKAQQEMSRRSDLLRKMRGEQDPKIINRDTKFLSLSAVRS